MAQTEKPDQGGEVAAHAANGVAAVIVTYFPDPVALRELLRAVAPQVERLVVVDNTPASDAAPASLPQPPAVHSRGSETISNGHNLGLAAAQNQGIAWAKARGASAVVLFDQDSFPAPDMVERLLAALAALRAQGAQVGALGPRWHDRHGKSDAPFVRLGFGRMINHGCAGAAAPMIECDTLVASGCLMPMASIDAVGPMNESLFIDQVDVEWGMRAQARGLRLFGVCDAVLYHGIGERTVRPWFARSRRMPVHAPLRDYYLVRNIIAVFFMRPAPWRWRLLQAVRLPAVMLVMVTQMPPRWTRLKLILRGVGDAMRGRLGPCV
ncbi:MAG TPA: glycosyltransferase family 2 protein [Burkholderiaceae bacterium]|nr:glycosyltransferase family 2 protein [Burkholderiaceae bacterium]